MLRLEREGCGHDGMRVEGLRYGGILLVAFVFVALC